MTYDPIPIVGVELGSRLENTALSVTERVYVPTGEMFTDVSHDHPRGWPRLETRERFSVEYHVKHLERRRPPVRYKSIAERVAELVRAVGECVLVIDITRTGLPVYALIMNAVSSVLEETGTHLTRCPVTVTGVVGGVTHGPDGWLVPRRDLVTSALVLFEQDRLKIAEGLQLADTLAREFPNLKEKSDPKDDSLEGWREAKNDDLVISVAMGVWAAERFMRKEKYRVIDLIRNTR